MNLENFPIIQKNILKVSEYIKTSEAKVFDTTEFLSYFSNENKELLSPISDYLNIYLNCLNNVVRWKQTPNQILVKQYPETDYDHICGMYEILNDVKNLKTKSIDFNIVELQILIHDGSEIITDDLAILHSSEEESYFQSIKKLEPKVFHPLILSQIKGRENFKTREIINTLFKRYESRNDNPLDTESHLVKLIDMIQGDIFGLENINSKNKYKLEYGCGIPEETVNFTESRIKKETLQLKKILDSMNDQEDKMKLFSCFKNKYFIKFSNPEHGYQDLYEKYLPEVEFFNPASPSF